MVRGLRERNGKNGATFLVSEKGPNSQLSKRK